MLLPPQCPLLLICHLYFTASFRWVLLDRVETVPSFIIWTDMGFVRVPLGFLSLIFSLSKLTGPFTEKDRTLYETSRGRHIQFLNDKLIIGGSFGEMGCMIIYYIEMNNICYS